LSGLGASFLSPEVACKALSPIEFLDNGKVIAGGRSGKYQFLDESRIEIDFGQGAGIAEYKISDGKLSLTTSTATFNISCQFSKSVK